MHSFILQQQKRRLAAALAVSLSLSVSAQAAPAVYSPDKDIRAAQQSRIEAPAALPAPASETQQGSASPVQARYVREVAFQADPEYKALQGVGVGLGYSVADDWNLRLDYTRKVRGKPDESESKNHDGRLWLRAVKQF